MDRDPTLLEVDAHALADARLHEAALLRLCADLATSSSAPIITCHEAQVVRLASQLLRSSYPSAAARLQQAYEAHRCEHCDSLPLTTALDQGSVLGLARFRDMLGRQLSETMS